MVLFSEMQPFYLRYLEYYAMIQDSTFLDVTG